MPGWQALYELLLNEDMTADDVVMAMGVKPSRLRRMLKSKRLESRLTLAQAVADRKASHAIIVAIAPATHKLSELTESQRPETVRRACLDILATAKQVYRKNKERKAGTRD